MAASDCFPVLFFLFFALFTGGISIAVLVGNKGFSTGSCCLPASCNGTLLDAGLLRPASVNGICQLTEEQAALLGCPAASNNTGCAVGAGDITICNAFSVTTNFAQMAGILGVSSPFSPVIGALLGVGLMILGEGGNKDSRGFFCIMIITVISMYISTTVYAGKSHYHLKEYPDLAWGQYPAQACSTYNATTGTCVAWSGPPVVFVHNGTVPNASCALAGVTAALYGGRLSGNVRTPIVMLFSLPLVYVGTWIGLFVLYAVSTKIRDQLYSLLVPKWPGNSEQHPQARKISPEAGLNEGDVQKASLY